MPAYERAPPSRPIDARFPPAPSWYATVFGVDAAGFGEGLALLGHPSLALWLALGAVIGIVFGAVPGVAGPVAMAAVITVIPGMEPIDAILFLSAIYTGSICGGSISAILLNMPGQPGSEPTALEGFRLVQRGESDVALGISLYASVAGIAIAYVAFLAAIGPASDIARFMGPADRAAITIAAVMLVGGLRSRSVLRGALAGLFGLMLGTLGATQTGIFRSSFTGVPLLFDGLPLLPTVLGLIALSELIAFLGPQYLTAAGAAASPPGLTDILKQGTTWFRYRSHTAAGSILGFVIGVMPAAGSSVAALFAHGQVRAWTRKREDAGKAGLAAAESANNAAEGGAMLIMLVLGIPGSGATAILLSGFLTFGLAPGPLFARENLPFMYAIAVGNLALAFILIPVIAIFMSALSRVIRLQLRYLAPVLFVVSSVGVFSLRSAVLDVVLLWVFAYLGYVLKKNDLPPMAVLLGFLLGPIIDAELYRVQAVYRGAFTQLLGRPVVIVSAVLTLLILARPILGAVRERISPSPDIDSVS